ncbi:MAG: hypothetical protein VX768_21295 [Planctomycetota bacterium]|nr:hypothetical protein [Planctomycetota bacterium]
MKKTGYGAADRRPIMDSIPDDAMIAQLYIPDSYVPFIVAYIVYVLLSSIALIALIRRAYTTFRQRRPFPFFAAVTVITTVFGTLAVTVWVAIFDRWPFGSLVYGEWEVLQKFFFIGSFVGVFVWISWANVWLSNLRPPPPNQPWIQFSLRKTMALVLLLAVIFTWLRMREQEATRQRKVVEQLVQQGWQLSPDPRGDSRTPYGQFPHSLRCVIFGLSKELNLHNRKSRIYHPYPK